MVFAADCVASTFAADCFTAAAARYGVLTLFGLVQAPSNGRPLSKRPSNTFPSAVFRMPAWPRQPGTSKKLQVKEQCRVPGPRTLPVGDAVDPFPVIRALVRPGPHACQKDHNPTSTVGATNTWAGRVGEGVAEQPGLLNCELGMVLH